MKTTSVDWKKSLLHSSLLFKNRYLPHYGVKRRGRATFKKSVISLTIGTALAVTLGTASIASSGEKPFAVQSLGKGYMVAEYHEGSTKEGYGEKKSGEGRCGMFMADTDKDGRVSKEEHARHCQQMFEKMDANGDGYIDKAEANKMRMKYKRGHRSSSGHRSFDESSMPMQAPLEDDTPEKR